MHSRDVGEKPFPGSCMLTLRKIGPGRTCSESLQHTVTMATGIYPGFSFASSFFYLIGFTPATAELPRSLLEMQIVVSSQDPQSRKKRKKTKPKEKGLFHSPETTVGLSAWKARRQGADGPRITYGT